MKAGSAPLWLVCIVTLIAGSSAALAQTDDEMNAANNPLQPTLGINLHNIYVDSYYGLRDVDSNSGLLRGSMPHKLSANRSCCVPRCRSLPRPTSRLPASRPMWAI